VGLLLRIWYTLPRRPIGPDFFVPGIFDYHLSNRVAQPLANHV
jgi:hypothetical protein